MGLFYSYPQQTFQEVPGEITLALSISGCPLRCRGCHSQETYDPVFGTELTVDELDVLLKKYRHTTCVLFYGGEWDLNSLIQLVSTIREKEIKTCLYSGMELNFFSQDIVNKFDFIKVGPYIEKRGNLRSLTTNQRFFQIENGCLIDKTGWFHHSPSRSTTS